MQETHDKRSQLFKLLILEHLKLKDQLSTAEAEFQKKEEWREAEIKRLQDDIERRATLHETLKKDLEGALLAKADADKQRDITTAALKDRAQNDQKIKAKCEEDDAKRKKAESELVELKSQSIEWLNLLKLINREMTSKSIRLFLISEFNSLGCPLTMLISCRGVCAF